LTLRIGLAGGDASMTLLRVLALGLTLTLLAVGVPALHEHRGDHPALYDDACPLSQLGASGDKVGVLPVFALIEPLVPVEIGPHPVPDRGGAEASCLPSAPRAPPATG
jgi:hypothetical protein